jgi:anti-sigma factor RsiW
MMERHLTCAEVDELLVPYMDGELALAEHAAVAAHMAACPACRRVERQHRRAWTLLEELPAAPTAPSVWPEVVARTHRIGARVRLVRRIAVAAALVFSVALVHFGYQRFTATAPDPHLLANLPVVEQYASLCDAGGEGLSEDLDIVQAVVELAQETEDF